MMTTAKIFDAGMSGTGVELEIAQSAIRVLLSCVASEDKDVSDTHHHNFKLMAYNVILARCIYEKGGGGGGGGTCLIQFIT